MHCHQGRKNVREGHPLALPGGASSNLPSDITFFRARAQLQKQVPEKESQSPQRGSDPALSQRRRSHLQLQKAALTSQRPEVHLCGHAWHTHHPTDPPQVCELVIPRLSCEEAPSFWPSLDASFSGRPSRAPGGLPPGQEWTNGYISRQLGARRPNRIRCDRAHRGTSTCCLHLLGERLEKARASGRTPEKREKGQLIPGCWKKKNIGRGGEIKIGTELGWRSPPLPPGFL